MCYPSFLRLVLNLNAFSKTTMTFQQMDINQLGRESKQEIDRIIIIIITIFFSECAFFQPSIWLQQSFPANSSNCAYYLQHSYLVIKKISSHLLTSKAKGDTLCVPFQAAFPALNSTISRFRRSTTEPEHNKQLRLFSNVTSKWVCRLAHFNVRWSFCFQYQYIMSYCCHGNYGWKPNYNYHICAELNVSQKYW